MITMVIWIIIINDLYSSLVLTRSVEPYLLLRTGLEHTNITFFSIINSVFCLEERAEPHNGR
jgi:hypothetical protein